MEEIKSWQVIENSEELPVREKHYSESGTGSILAESTERQADSASESWTESILAESAEQRTVPTAERAAAVLAESVQ